MGPVTGGGTNAHKGGATLRRAGASLTATAHRAYTVGDARGEGV